MKVLVFFLTTLFNQDSFLVKQGGVEVPLADLDAYVYLLNNDKRAGFAMQKQQIEKNIFTLLNVNIVYNHVVSTDLKDHEIFKSIATNINASDIETEELFLEALDVNKERMIDSIKMYSIKTEYYKALLSHVKDSFTDETLEKLALEYYMINKKEFLIPEKRDLSVITLNSDGPNEVLDTTLNELSAATQESFHETASKKSTDPSVTSNNGHWGIYKKNNFNYRFSNTVFNSSVGVIPNILEDKGNKYIIRVNEIFPQVQGTFDEVKEGIIKQLKDKAVVRKFQSIINSKGNEEVQVNPELIAHVFERYKVFNRE